MNRLIILISGTQDFYFDFEVEAITPDIERIARRRAYLEVFGAFPENELSDRSIKHFTEVIKVKTLQLP